MRQLKNKIFALTVFGTFGLALKASAICPVCVVAVGAGLGLSEYLGIDDTIAGVWIGGLLVAMSAWTINWFNKKNWPLGNKDLRDIVIFILYYGLTIWPLFAKNLIGSPYNRLWGIDKLIFGIIIGSIGFALAVLWYNNLKKKNNGHAYFPFQKVVQPLGALIILSFVFYFLTK
jgi:hypothetical protein